MKYQNAQTTLPQELLRDIQKYVQGTYLYIPVQEECRKEWGAYTGSKQVLQERNARIVQAYGLGISVKTLAKEYFLTEHSIRRIIREKPNVQL
ncbi:CD3324 family protein [Brevibacillus sp. NRS-1366]|uniref:CD3324 family protein n=1 Tax=Brevibacillus sp. NRS-1366 TaxID=3233899 RepID=UPI003D1D255B